MHSSALPLTNLPHWRVRVAGSPTARNISAQLSDLASKKENQCFSEVGLGRAQFRSGGKCTCNFVSFQKVKKHSKAIRISNLSCLAKAANNYPRSLGSIQI